MVMNTPATSPVHGLQSAIDARTPDLAHTIWRRVEVVDSTGSTNADLAARADESDLVGTVRITTDQTAGRGRRARTWSAPAGAQLAISAVVPVGAHTEQLGWLSLTTGIATATAIERHSGLRPVLKWPNDVLIDDRKIAGILAEYVTSTDGGVVVVGTGLNTNLTSDDLPVPTATSLRIETGRELAADDLAGLAIEYLRALDEQGWPDRLDAIAETYRQRCDTLGRRVRLLLPGDTEIVGQAVDVDDNGRIVIQRDGGERFTAAAGDVVHLRPVAD
ncbi:biotin--[acetyl-CoA-carboxylase] ligase [Gordonia polyisoprenivorans]|uniref:biotin--[acetyl-CoA-carboxylase] ligase n=1 Tax=Gordonia polyisoprenivorans TaxID=84595 RepID=UPI0003618CCE|nr:biotin--[acetyl-CoA-carboxylase] ligase [Gordonia polyisoprenivorans]